MKKQETKSTRNDGRMTHVEGIIANVQEQTFTTFECDVPYARSNDKLSKSVREVMKLDDACMVSISKVEQTETQRVVYNMNALYLSDAEQFADEEAAKVRAKEIDEKVVTGAVYHYSTQVFYYDMKNDEYGTMPFYWTSGSNFTAIDARAMLAMRFEEMHKDCRTIALHFWGNQKGYTKNEQTMFYVASAELLKGCERVVKHRK